MTALTTRQRDLLMLLLAAGGPVGMADLADELRLTPRQISYDLKPLEHWLMQRNVTLRVTPGVGVDVQGTTERRRSIAKELASATDLQLVLSGKQRQQLLLFTLLTSKDPVIIFQLQQQAQVSRTTIIKDLDCVESWLNQHGLRIERKPNFGIQIDGAESAKRQALASMIWGDPALGEPLTRLTHVDGLTFELADDRTLLPLVTQAYALMRRWDTRRTAVLVAEAEALFGGRFSDDAVLYLALVFVLQAQRVQAGQTVAVETATLVWLKSLQVWPIAERIAAKLSWLWQASWPETEIAWVAMHLLAAPRNESWPSDPGLGSAYTELVTEMMHRLAVAYDLPALEQDQTLHEGLINDVIPACLRQRFGLPMAPLMNSEPLSQDFAMESAVAQQLVTLIGERMGVSLPESEVNSLGLLLRAAYIRERQDYVRNVIVVCPSGMATAQLIVARMKAYFPRLGSYRVVSLRELRDAAIPAAHLIITTVPLPAGFGGNTRVIQVHPLLLPQDVANITQWLAS